jgi:hypothetical protein
MTNPNRERARMDKFYPSSGIKRVRSTKLVTNTRRSRIYQIVEENQPMTVRQVYYQAVVHNLVDKTEKGYDQVQDDLTKLRRSGELPYDWLIDEGRRARKPYTVQGLAQALNDTRRSYRLDPWRGVGAVVQIWLERNALAGVIEAVTDEYDVALMVTALFLDHLRLRGRAVA